MNLQLQLRAGKLQQSLFRRDVVSQQYLQYSTIPKDSKRFQKIPKDSKIHLKILEAWCLLLASVETMAGICPNICKQMRVALESTQINSCFAGWIWMVSDLRLQSSTMFGSNESHNVWPMFVWNCRGFAVAKRFGTGHYGWSNVRPNRWWTSDLI